MNFCGAIIIQIHKNWLLWVSKYFIIDFKFLDNDIDFPLKWLLVFKKTSLLNTTTTKSDLDKYLTRPCKNKTDLVSKMKQL